MLHDNAIAHRKNNKTNKPTPKPKAKHILFCLQSELGITVSNVAYQQSSGVGVLDSTGGEMHVIGEVQDCPRSNSMNWHNKLLSLRVADQFMLIILLKRE